MDPTLCKSRAQTWRFTEKTKKKTQNELLHSKSFTRILYDLLLLKAANASF